MAGREKTAAEKAWQSAYDKEHFRDFTLRLRKDADAALIEKMDSVPNKNAYLRDLIHADIAGAEDELENIDKTTFGFPQIASGRRSLFRI